MLKLPKPSAVWWDIRALRTSMRVRSFLPRLPEVSPDAATFWAERQVDVGPLPDLAASMQVLERTEAGTISSFAFPSRVVSPDALNNRVSGCYYLPAQQKGENAAPFLLLLHANGIRDWGLESWHARRLMQRGCCVAHIALPYQLDRCPPHLNGGATVIASDLVHTLLALEQAVCDAADVLRWARAAGAQRLLIAGWSLGGLVAALVATQMPLDAALLVEPAANLAWEMTHRGLFGWSARQRLRAVPR